MQITIMTEFLPISISASSRPSSLASHPHPASNHSHLYSSDTLPKVRLTRLLPFLLLKKIVLFSGSPVIVAVNTCFKPKFCPSGFQLGKKKLKHFIHVFTKRNTCGYQDAMQYVKFGMLFVPQAINKKIFFKKASAQVPTH